MYYASLAAGGTAFAASLAGYALLYRKRLALPMCFFPAVCFSGMAVAVYLFGLLDLLGPGCLIAAAGGWAALILCRDRDWRALADPSLLLFVFGTVWLFVITRGVMPSHWDDLTHWFRICAVMDADGTLPTAPDIRFYTYVPGTAVWIHLVTRFTGFNEANCYFAQGLLDLAGVVCLFAPFARAEDRKLRLLGLLPVGLGGILLCSMDVSTYVLLVDTVLALMPMAALLLALDGEEDRSVLFSGCLLLCFTALIKNSGLFLAAATWILACLRRRFPLRRWLASAALWAALPALLHRLYGLRAARYYADGALQDPQAMDSGRYLRILGEKSPQSLAKLRGDFLRAVTDTGGEPAVRAVWLWLAVFLVLALLALALGRREEGARVLRHWAAGLCLAAAWCGGLLATYVFSMSVEEADRLACFYRYFGTIAIYLVGAGTYLLLRAAVDGGGRTVLSVLASVLLIVYTQSSFSTGYLWGYAHYEPVEPYSTDIWAAFRRCVPPDRQYTETSYLIMWDADEFARNTPALFRNTATIYLRSTHVRGIPIQDFAGGVSEEELRKLSDYDYLVTLSDIPETVRDLYPYLGIREEDYHLGICPIPGPPDE